MDKRAHIYVNGVWIMPGEWKHKKDALVHLRELERGARRFNEDCRYTVRQVDYTVDRRNKQARRAFESQEV